MVSQISTKEEALKKKEREGKVAGWNANNQLVKDTEEMVSWRSINQEEIDEV